MVSSNSPKLLNLIGHKVDGLRHSQLLLLEIQRLMLCVSRVGLVRFSYGKISEEIFGMWDLSWGRHCFLVGLGGVGQDNRGEGRPG